jgi:hypothetical protein
MYQYASRGGRVLASPLAPLLVLGQAGPRAASGDLGRSRLTRR